MSLIKSCSTNKGVPASYWKIGAEQYDWINKRAQITLVGYLDETTKNKIGSQPLGAYVYKFAGSSGPLAFDFDRSVSSQPLTAQVYFKLKNLPPNFGDLTGLPSWCDAKDSL